MLSGLKASGSNNSNRLSFNDENLDIDSNNGKQKKEIPSIGANLCFQQDGDKYKATAYPGFFMSERAEADLLAYDLGLPKIVFGTVKEISGNNLYVSILKILN